MSLGNRLFLETGKDSEGKEILVPFGTLDSGFTFKSRPDKPLADCIDSYVQKYTSKKSKMTRTNEKTYFRHLAKYLTEQDVHLISKVTPAHMNDYRDMLLSRVAPPTVNRHFNTFKAFFNVKLKKDIIGINPCCEIEPEAVEDPVIHLWNVADYETVKTALDEPTSRLLEFMWLTGARNCEAVNLVWEDVIQDQNYIILRSKKNRGGKRKIRISDKVSVLLHKAARGVHVFSDSRGYAYTSDSLCKRVRKAVVESATNKKIRAYGVRHTFCKDLLQAGFSRPMIQELMGHVDWRTTEKYKHWGDSILTNALNSVR